MVSDNIGKQLHDQFTRGKSLSSEEQSLLQEWYGIQDSLENNLLINDENILKTVQIQLDSALDQLMIVTKRVQEMAAENEALKQEVLELRGQWVQQSSMSFA